MIFLLSLFQAQPEAHPGRLVKSVNFSSVRMGQKSISMLPPLFSQADMTNEKMSATLDSAFNESNPPSTNYGESDSFFRSYANC